MVVDFPRAPAYEILRRSFPANALHLACMTRVPKQALRPLRFLAPPTTDAPAAGVRLPPAADDPELAGPFERDEQTLLAALDRPLPPAAPPGERRLRPTLRTAGRPKRNGLRHPWLVDPNPNLVRHRWHVAPWLGALFALRWPRSALRVVSASA